MRYILAFLAIVLLAVISAPMHADEKEPAKDAKANDDLWGAEPVAEEPAKKEGDSGKAAPAPAADAEKKPEAGVEKKPEKKEKKEKKELSDKEKARLEKAAEAGKKAEELKKQKEEEEQKLKALLALAKQLCPELLEMRLQFDVLAKQYEDMYRQLGLKNWKNAERYGPKLRRELEKILEHMARQMERDAKSYERSHKNSKKEQAVLIQRIDKLYNKGKSPDKYKAELEKVEAELAKSEQAIEALQALAEPTFSVERAANIILYDKIKPTYHEEGDFKSLFKKHPDMIYARLYIEHIRGDIAACQAAVDEGKASPARVARMKKAEGKAIARFTELHTEAVEVLNEQIRELKEEDAKLTEKVDRLRGKPSGVKYEQRQTTLASKIERLNKSLNLLKRLSLVDPKKAAKKDAKKEDKGNGDEEKAQPEAKKQPAEEKDAAKDKKAAEEKADAKKH